MIAPVILKTKDVHRYVGGKPVFDELLRAFPEQLVPFRRTPRGDTQWRIEVIDHVLKLAQATGSLIS